MKKQKRQRFYTIMREQQLHVTPASALIMLYEWFNSILWLTVLKASHKFGLVEFKIYCYSKSTAKINIYL